MQDTRVFPAKRQDDNCTRRYSKDSGIKMRNIFVNQTTLMKYKSSLSCAESTNNIKIKIKLATEL